MCHVLHACHTHQIPLFANFAAIIHRVGIIGTCSACRRSRWLRLTRRKAAAAPDAAEVAGRREAIAEAIRIAKAGDIILLAGKGHETGQIIGAGASQRVLPFDDALVARECAS